MSLSEKALFSRALRHYSALLSAVDRPVARSGVTSRTGSTPEMVVDTFLLWSGTLTDVVADIDKDEHQGSHNQTQARVLQSLLRSGVIKYLLQLAIDCIPIVSLMNYPGPTIVRNKSMYRTVSTAVL